MTQRVVTPAELERMLGDGDEIAVVDVREHGEYGEGHLLFCVSVPWSRFELDLPRLVPNRRVRMVVYDQADGAVAAKAAAAATALGYTHVARLDGGLEGWRAAGYGVFAGVNVPSKTLGELVEQAYGTPSITAEELAERQQRGEPAVVLDGRPWEGYRAWSIPEATSCPNAELPYRLGELLPDEETPVVVNCAGRTRSIIGCEMLRQFGVGNPVYALRNGTMGWRLAGLELDHGAERRSPAGEPPPDVDRRRRRALEMAYRAGVQRAPAEEVRAWLGEDERTTYLLDVRDPREYQQAHLRGAASAPGGQLIQATDQWVGVRRARIVLVDDTEVRAAACGFWLTQMDFEVAILAGGASAWWDTEAGAPADARPGTAERVSVEALSQALAGEPAPLLLDCQPSMVYRKAHAPEAIWVIRPRLEAAMAGRERSVPVRIMGRGEAAAELLARDLEALGFSDVAVLAGGIEAWKAAGQPLVSTPGTPADEECLDFLFFVHDRHHGNLESAKRYLAWEHGLVDSLRPSERAHFRLCVPLR